MMNSERFQLWTALTCFSLVNLISHHAELADNAGDRNTADRWVLSVSSISLMMGFLACVSHLIWKDAFSGSKIEGMFILFVFGFWCAGLPALLDPGDDFAINYSTSTRNPLFVDNATTYPISFDVMDVMQDLKIPPRKLSILHANIFFSSWAAFTIALFLGIGRCQQAFERYDSMSAHWTGLFTASFVVMASASHIWHDENCVDDSDDGSEVLYFEEFCNRTMFAVILGLLSGLSGVVICFLRLKIVDHIGSMLSLLVWCFAAVYVTYTDANPSPYENIGPGKDPGTLYFATWACLIISLKIASKLLIETVIPDCAEDAPQGEVGDIPTEGGRVVKDHDYEDSEEEEVEIVAV